MHLVRSTDTCCPLLKTCNKRGFESLYLLLAALLGAHNRRGLQTQPLPVAASTAEGAQQTRVANTTVTCCCQARQTAEPGSHRLPRNSFGEAAPRRPLQSTVARASDLLVNETGTVCSHSEDSVYTTMWLKSAALAVSAGTVNELELL